MISPEMSAVLMYIGTIISALALLLVHSEEEEEPDTWKRK